MDVKMEIENTITDLVSDFLYYDRKEDESLPMDAIEKAIRDGDITIDEIIQKFTDELKNGLVT